MNLHFFFNLLPLAFRMLLGLENARGTAYIFNQLRPIFITVCFEFYFLAFHLVLHYIEINFFMNIFLFLGCVPLAGRILGGLRKYYRPGVLCAFEVN